MACFGVFVEPSLVRKNTYELNVSAKLLSLASQHRTTNEPLLQNHSDIYKIRWYAPDQKQTMGCPSII